MTAQRQHDNIAEIAYRAWLDRGQPDGSPEIDWYYALSVISNPEEIRPVPVSDFSGDGENTQEQTQVAGSGDLDRDQRQVESSSSRSRRGKQSSSSR